MFLREITFSCNTRWPGLTSSWLDKLHDDLHYDGAGLGHDQAVAREVLQGGVGGAHDRSVTLVGRGAVVADHAEVPQKLGLVLWQGFTFLCKVLPFWQGFTFPASTIIPKPKD